MRYEVRPTSSARRDLDRLPESVAAAVLEFVFGALAARPHRVGKPLLGPLAGRHSARRGQYRVVYEIDDPTQVVTILNVSHRPDTYRS